MGQHFRACSVHLPHQPHRYLGPVAGRIYWISCAGIDKPLSISDTMMKAVGDRMDEIREALAKQRPVVIAQEAEVKEVTDLELIREVIVPKLLRHMELKGKDYGPTNHRVLGPRGQFADMWRKMPKLKKGMWDGEELFGEQVDEILYDLAGHVLLTLVMLEGEDPQPL